MYIYTIIEYILLYLIYIYIYIYNMLYKQNYMNNKNLDSDNELFNWIGISEMI